MALVVHVVQQPDDAPQLLVLAVARARRRASRPRRPGSGGAGTRDCDPLASEGSRPRRAKACTDMAVRLAEPPIPPPQAAPLIVMEKFVIDGGVPLRGTVAPAGNKNGALPILAASVLTTDEVVVRNVPRIRDVEAMLRVLRGLGATRRVARRQRGRHLRRRRRPRGATSTASTPSASARRSCSPARCWRASARADMPPPGGDVIGRRRLDPHLDAFRALGARLRARPRHRALAPNGGLRAGEVFMDEPSVMATENALHGRRADARHDDHRQRRLRAPRPGPRADAGQDGRRHPRDRLQRAHRQRQARARRLHPRRRPRPHRDRLVHRPGRRDRRRDRGSRTPSPRTCG